MFNALHSLFGGRSRRVPAGHAPRRTRLTLECLEDRVVPSATSGAQAPDPTTTGPSQAGPLSPLDLTYLIYEAQGDQQEMALGQLAMQRGSSTLVKEFGYLLYTQHMQTLESTIPVLQQYGLPVPTMSPSNFQNIMQLLPYQGTQFDQQFAQFMVQDHEQDIALSVDELNNGTSTSVKQDAYSGLPILYEHLYIAMTIQQQEGTPSS